MKLNKRGMVALVLAGAMVLSSCGSQKAASSSAGGKYTAGTYTGEGQGYGGIGVVALTYVKEPREGTQHSEILVKEAELAAG